MKKHVLIYLWIFIGIYGAIEAGDADEHVHIKLHMPKTGGRKSGHHHQRHQHQHTRHKKNPPPYGGPLGGHAHISSVPHPELGSGPGLSHTHVYHDTPHNYLTGQHLSPPHYLHGHHGRKQPPSSAVTHLHAVDGGGGGHQQLMESEFYTSEDGDGGSTTTGLGSSIISENGDLTLNEFLASNFAAFPQPTTFEAEIMSSPQTNAELAYHRRQKTREASHHYGHAAQPNFDSVAANVIAANQELEEDNEILGPFVRTTTSLLGDAIGGDWTPHHPKPPRGLSSSSSSSSFKALKNEHLLKHIMQHQQQKQPEQQHPSFPYQPEIMNTVATAALLRTSSSKDKYRDDKLHELEDGTTATTDAERDSELDAIQAYDDMDLVTAYSDDGGAHRDGSYGGEGDGIKALTVDDIWSQLQRTYLSKYTPQAQPVREESEENSPSTKKFKRNSPKLKTRKRHQHHNRSATPSPTEPPPPSTSFSAGQTLKYGNNYYSQEQPKKHSPPSLYGNQHQQHQTPEKSYSVSSFTPYSSYRTTSSSSSLTDADLYETRAITATRPPHHSFTSAINYERGEPNGDHFDENIEDDDTSGYTSETFDEASLSNYSSDEDASPEESMFSTSHKKLGTNRIHRHSNGNAAFGTPGLNYQDLYASYSTPISATIATSSASYSSPISTYHPNSFIVSAPQTPATGVSQQKQTDSGPTPSHESTSYQWLEQQHYPSAPYQAYHHRHHQLQQQQFNHKRPQTLQLQQYHPQTTNALRLPKATVAASSMSPPPSSAAAPTLSSSLSLNQSPLASTSSSTGFSANDFTTGVKPSTTPQQQPQQQQQQQQRYKKRKNRLKSKRNRIVVT